MKAMPTVGDTDTLGGLLERSARDDGSRVYCRFGEQEITCRALDERVNRLANGLARLGLREGDRVAVMLANHPDHVYTFFALAKLGVTWVPINVHLKGASLEYIIRHAEPRAVIADAAYRVRVLAALQGRPVDFVIWRGGAGGGHPGRAVDFAGLAETGEIAPPERRARADDVVCISYTSGTTGTPKGVPLTDKMLRACGTVVAVVADVRPGDVLLLWEPLYHNGGHQVLVTGLMEPVTIALLERFSASRFWNQVRHHGATQIHYLGGILAMLLNRPPRAQDADNPVRIAWGGGCTPEVWRRFEERFGVVIQEDYGMTESSGFTTVNTTGKLGSIGRPLPYFEVRILDNDATPLGPDRIGEMAVREKQPGFIMKGYFRNPDATRAAIRDGWLHTGDLGYYDPDGDFYYAGRKTDSLRRRGENISAWEVERIVDDHPDIEESAVIGVPAALGEDDVKVFVKPVAGRRPEPLDVIKWCEARMPYFQVPRYVAFVEGFEKTPTHRIRKEGLSRSTEDCWDLDASGYALSGDGKRS